MSSSEVTERLVGVKLSGSSLPRLMLRRGRMRNLSAATVGMISFPPVCKIRASPRLSIPRAFRDHSVS
jgi:hypothetical protein